MEWNSFDDKDYYDFGNKEATKKYLKNFETGESEISIRNGIEIRDFYIERQV